MRIDHGQRLVEHDDVDVGADQPAAERDLLLAVRREAGGALLQRRPRRSSMRAISCTARVDLGLGHAAIAQRERQIVVDRHGVVDDRELEHLRDVALVGRHVGQVDVVEQHAAFGRPHQAGDDVEQGGLAAAGRPEQRIGAAVLTTRCRAASAPSRRRRCGLCRDSCACRFVAMTRHPAPVHRASLMARPAFRRRRNTCIAPTSI